ncbi:integrase family protein [Paraburkholderia hospita]|uniref:Integrase family protein n=1 Tax=Paraburkholderia hospita TaxID=169430 RepID=A0ABP2PSC0_9BURK|nr:integrase arm-type DNA-binding domain-containing protein [Paraburkholderia hospita]EIN00390.1 integrase family protein [Paraburkholderia hospita]OUL88401.1 integrase [Paraburkholderia hospita]
MSLTDIKIKQAKPREKLYKVSDERGLYLEVTPTGSKWWRFKYRIDGKEKRLSLGVYPDVGLQKAREKRDEARKLVADGVDPSAHRKAQKQARADANANSFEVVTREWLEKQRKVWEDSHAEKVTRRFERDVFPWLGKRPIAEIKPVELLTVLRRIEARVVETAHRAKQNCGQVFRYAVATGRAERDITVDLKGALTPWKEEHFASITDPEEIGPLLRDMYAYKGTFEVQCCLRIAPHVFLRPVELRLAEWQEFDLDNARWDIPGERMKMRKPHIVPLSTQVVEILRELYPLTGDGVFVFRGRNPRSAISDNTVNKALRSMGYSTKDDITGHGFRAMARTVLDERLRFPYDWIEHQLAHTVRDANGRAYNRTAHLDGRREMMQAWSDYLDKLRASTD